MINLRYHIVSVVAVFLALGIGLALGSTFVDSILVNELEDQVNEFKVGRDDAIDSKDQAIADKERAQEELETLRTDWLREAQVHDEQLQDLRRSSTEEVNAIGKQIDNERQENTLTLNAIEALMPRDRLEGTSWVIVAPTGVDLLGIAKIRESLIESDGEYLGTLWIRPAMNLKEPETLTALADLLGVKPSDAELPELVISHIASWLTEREGLNNQDDQIVEDLIGQMGVLGLLRHDRYGSSAPSNQVVTSDKKVIFINDSVHMGLHQELFMSLLEELAELSEQGVGALVELTNESSPVGEVVNKVRNDADLAESWSTFDEVGSLEGRLGLLIGLSRLPSVGHYGILPTAEERFPR